MARLSDLSPQIGDTPEGCDGSFNFACPACRSGRIVVWLVLGDQPRNRAHATNLLPPQWDHMTITPSIAADNGCTRANRGCPGWHGHIVNGEALP